MSIVVLKWNDMKQKMCGRIRKQAVLILKMKPCINFFQNKQTKEHSNEYAYMDNFGTGHYYWPRK
jgi:hypothetical protein